ncbi:hypothetical protein T484DRAFT_1802874, partial [Baffinella frigidus]
LRLARRGAAFPNDTLPSLHRTLLASFLPTAVRVQLEEVLQGCAKRAGLVTKGDEEGAGAYTINIADGRVEIGGVSFPQGKPTDEALVPDVVFHDIPRHVEILREVLKDLSSGERHLLLIGNQGVGKNKLADRLLGALRLEREYIQLHRDSTVQSLTLQPSLEGGVVTYGDSPLVRACREPSLQPSLEGGVVAYGDSPLVRACREGRVLMVDEADKAPREVVCILKGLLDDGHMALSDGRRLETLLDYEAEKDDVVSDVISIHPTFLYSDDVPSDVIPIHPNFRAVVLANRPGFPFLGNDFFAECGDVLSCHAIDNPDMLSEVALLRAYAPDVAPELLQRLSHLFADLRAAVEDGTLAYPYSTRELVNLNYPC